MKMLINAQRAEQIRVAIVDGTTLTAYQVEIAEAGLCRGNIYRGVVANLQPSLNAAFIDIGEERHGFLPLGDVLPSAYHRQPKEGGRARIDEVLERGRPIIVQVAKDGVGQKGAALTTNVALAGRYLVMMPFDDVRGISRKANDDEARKKVRERLDKLVLPPGQGVIVRTNGIDQNQTTLSRDLSALERLWKQIKAESSKGRGPRLLYSDQDLLVQALRDYLDNNIEAVVVDDDAAYAKAESYMQAFMPRARTQLVRYEERLPLFSRYHLETQIESIYDRVVPLPGGGSIVIDNTEALTAIDVNSGRATMYGDHDETVLNVNIEAAQEVARQLRLRDIGGLVVVDFIDMRMRKHQRRLEKELRETMKVDKARYSVSRISSNGLVEINRQRIKQALRLRTHSVCPTCSGTGSIANAEFAALGVLRRIEARAANGLLKSVLVALHPEVADALQNHHRRELAELEREFSFQIEIVSAANLARTEERLEWTQRAKAGAPLPTRPLAALSANDLKPQFRPGTEPLDDEDEDEDEGADLSPAAASAQQKPGGTKQQEARDAKAADPRVNGDAAAGNGNGGRKRRRRGGRRRRKHAVEAPLEGVLQAHPDESGAAPPAGEASPATEGIPSPPPAEAAAEEKPREGSPRSRSRRRRRRGDSREPRPLLPPSDALPSAAAAEDPAGRSNAAASPSEPPPSERQEITAEAGEAADRPVELRTGRSRSRRRRRRGGSSAVATPPDAVMQARAPEPGAPQPGAPEPGAPEPGAPRPRTRALKPGAPEPGAPQPSLPVETVRADREPEAKTAERGPAERGPAERGPAERGPAERGPADDSPEPKKARPRRRSRKSDAPAGTDAKAEPSSAPPEPQPPATAAPATEGPRRRAARPRKARQAAPPQPAWNWLGGVAEGNAPSSKREGPEES